MLHYRVGVGRLAHVALHSPLVVDVLAVHVGTDPRLFHDLLFGNLVLDGDSLRLSDRSTLQSLRTSFSVTYFGDVGRRLTKCALCW